MVSNAATLPVSLLGKVLNHAVLSESWLVTVHRNIRVVSSTWQAIADDDDLWTTLFAQALDCDEEPDFRWLHRHRPDVVNLYRQSMFPFTTNTSARLWTGGGPRVVDDVDRPVRSRYQAAHTTSQALEKHFIRFQCGGKYAGEAVVEAVEAAGGWSAVAEPALICNWLSWLLDPNWPAARDLNPLLESAPADELAPFLIDWFFSGHFDSDWLPYFFGIISRKYHPTFRPHLFRIATSPTEQERTEDVDEGAREVLEENGEWRGGA